MLRHEADFLECSLMDTYACLYLRTETDSVIMRTVFKVCVSVKTQKTPERSLAKESLNIEENNSRSISFKRAPTVLRMSRIISAKN